MQNSNKTQNFELLLNILENQMRQVGTSKKGTYNRQDPTAFENSEAYFLIEMYPVWHEEIKPSGDYPFGEPKGYQPEPKIVKVELKDCTWGVDIIISEVLEDLDSKEIVSNYWNHEDKKLCHGITEGADKKLADEVTRILTEGISMNYEKVKTTINTWHIESQNEEPAQIPSWME